MIKCENKLLILPNVPPSVKANYGSSWNRVSPNFSVPAAGFPSDYLSQYNLQGCLEFPAKYSPGARRSQERPPAAQKVLARLTPFQNTILIQSPAGLLLLQAIAMFDLR